MLKWLKNILSSPKALQASRLQRGLQIVRARSDAAVTNDANYRHWAGADGLSANAAASPEVRRILRNRARYEAANNSYARGIVLTLANDVVGTGPRLQMLTQDGEANSRIEREFFKWSQAVGLAGKLRTMRMARAVDGEAFGVLTSNPALDARINLDFRLVEAEQVAVAALWVMPVVGARWSSCSALR